MPSNFFITCAARTGSTMLRYLLDSHPQIGCHGEVFINQGLIRFVSRDRRSIILSPDYEDFTEDFKNLSLSEFLTDKLLNSENDQVKTVGFKFKTDEFFNSRFQEISIYLKGRIDLKVIHLRRRDLLAQYISYLFVQRKINPTFLFDKSAQDPSQKLKLKKRRLLAYLDNVVQREKKIESELSDHHVHTVWYEDLTNDMDKYLAEILSFLDVDQVSLVPKTQKLIKDYTAHIENLSEVLSWISESEYAIRVKRSLQA